MFAEHLNKKNKTPDKTELMRGEMSNRAKAFYVIFVSLDSFERGEPIHTPKLCKHASIYAVQRTNIHLHSF